MANTEVVDRATVKEYCEEYCRENIEEQCREIIQDCKDEERIKNDELGERALLWFKGLMPELDYVGCIAIVVTSSRCWFKKNLLIGIPLGELKLSDNRDTNMSEQPVEQITREPDVKDRVKDPKKVEAGKKLADYHKKAKEALKEKEQRDALIDSQKEKEQQQQQDALVKKDDDDDAWIPSRLSFDNFVKSVVPY